MKEIYLLGPSLNWRHLRYHKKLLHVTFRVDGYLYVTTLITQRDRTKRNIRYGTPTAEEIMETCMHAFLFDADTAVGLRHNLLVHSIQWTRR